MGGKYLVEMQPRSHRLQNIVCFVIRCVHDCGGST